MPIDVTNPPREHYQVDPTVVEDLQRRRSNYARAGGATEPDLHSFVFLHPELVTCYLDEEQSLVWRKEAKLSTANCVDLLALFYGRSRCDLIECKGPNEPIIGVRGITRNLNKSLAQLSRYRDAFTSGLPPDDRLHINIENRPRLVLIGEVKTRNPIPVPDQAALLEKALRSSDKWKQDYGRGLLIVMTWDMLAEKAKKAKIVPTSRWCNNVVTRVLGNFAWDTERQRTSLPSLDEFMARASAFNLQDQATLVETRAIEVIKTLKQLRVSPDRELYQSDGDMCCGQWGHGSTYGAITILDTLPTAWTAITDHLLKALASDTSVDVLGRTSHVLRYVPEHAKKLLVDDRTIRNRWRFPNPEALVTDPLLRPDLVNFMQVGYCLAQHGVEEAVAFMNQAAANPRLLNDIARWDTLHAKENPEQLMQSLRQKAERPTERQKPFLPWHKAIFEADGYMVERLKKAALITQ
jgi:hypothetical protein